MSSNLTIEPLYRSKKRLSDKLKFAIRKRNNNESVFSWKVTSNDIDYFTGLLDAGIEDAKKVIDMIEKYGECIINEEY